jgi:hypothetical protein
MVGGHHTNPRLQGQFYCRFGMDADCFKHNPFRPLKWRAERALRLVANHPSVRLGSHDDFYVRSYRDYLVAMLAAGDDEAEQEAAILQWSHVHQAHAFHYHADSEWRQILEAWLLTGETYDGIAKRLATEP